jgi:hypothetical protein
VNDQHDNSRDDNEMLKRYLAGELTEAQSERIVGGSGDETFTEEAAEIIRMVFGAEYDDPELTRKVASYLRELIGSREYGCTGVAAPDGPTLNVPAPHPFDGKPGPVGDGRVCLVCGQRYGSAAHPGSTLAGEDPVASGAAVLADATDEEVDGFLGAIREARGAVPRPSGSPRAEEVIRRLRDQIEPGV